MAQIVFNELASTPSPPASSQLSLYAKTDNVVYVQNSSGIETAIGTSNSITQLSGDVTAMGPGNAAATVVFVGGQSATNVAAATVLVESATYSNVANALVQRDSSGNFSASTITANLNGNASTSSSSVTAISFTGALAGDVTGHQSTTVVSFVGGQSAAAVAEAAIAVAASTPLNMANTLVERDASGNFAAGIITAALVGNVTGNVSGSSSSFTGALLGDVNGTQSATVVVAVQGSAVSNTVPTNAQLLIYNSTTSKWTPESMSGDAIINNAGSITLSPTAVTGKLLVGYTTGTNTPINAANSILTAFENLQAQISGTTGTAITALTGDVSASGPGSAAATIEAIQGNSVSGTTGTGNVVFSASPTLTGTITAAAANFSGAISASNFSGSSSGTNTGDVTVSNTNSIDLAFTSGQTGLNANLNLSASGPDAGYIPAVSEIKSDGLLVEVLAGTPVQIGTTNSIGSAASASRADHVHAVTSSVILGLLLTGYASGSNTPINATDTILVSFENLQAQISASVGAAITSLTGDVLATGPGAAAATVTALQGHSVSNTAPTDAQMLLWVTGSSSWVPTSISGDAAIADTGVLTLATVNSNVGSFGSSTAIPSFTVNAKGLITAASTNAVVAPAGTLTGTTLASNVVTSSLTSVGTIISGVWNGTALTAPYMLALPTADIYVGNGSNQPAAVAMSGDATIASSGAVTLSATAVTGKLLTGYATGTNTPINATNSILTAFENLQAQVSGTVGAAITSLTGDVTATGPGAAAATVTALQGHSVSNTAPTDAQILIYSNSATKYVPESLSGDINIAASGASTIQPNVVSNSKLAQAAAFTLKGNNTGVLANVTDLTISQINTMLATVTTIGAIDTNANSNGLFISGNTLSTQSASITNPGMVNNATQSFSGNKTFSGTVAISPSSTSALVINTTSFIFDSANNALGIGIQPSTAVLIDGVNSSGSSKALQLTGYGTGSTLPFRGRFARGTVGSPAAVQAGDTLAVFSGRGYGASQFASASTGAINVVANETFTNTSNQTYLQFLVTPTASVTAVEHMRVTATGVTLGAQSSSTDLHTVNGGWIRTTKTITANYTVDTTTTDDIILCNQSAGITITLPTPTVGRTIVIKDISGNAQTNTISVAQHASETIEGLAATKILYTNFGSWTFSVGAAGNWWMI